MGELHELADRLSGWGDNRAHALRHSRPRSLSEEKSMSIRVATCRLLVAASILFSALAAIAQNASDVYPDRPIRLIVNHPPGGPTDLTARTLAPKLQQLLGQQVIVDKLNTAINQVMTDPEAMKALTSQGAEPAGGAPDVLGNLMRGEYERWTKLARDAKLKFD